MKTSMLDALAQEQTEILKLVSEASRLAAEATRRGIALRDQIALQALEERMSPAEAEAEFQDFVRRNFTVGNSPVELPNTPGFLPQAQDSEEGNQGSGAAVPGGATAFDKAQPEQAVAEAASVERTATRNDAEAAPDASPVRELLLLDLFECKATYDEQTIQLTRLEMRLLHLLNSQVPVPTLQVLNRLPLLRRKAMLVEMILPLNQRLEQIGARIDELVGDHFQLQPIELV